MKIEPTERGTEPAVRGWDRYWTAREGDPEFYTNEDRIIRGLERTGGLSGRRLLEVGAGSGRDSLRAAAAGARVYCLDNSRESISLMVRIDPARRLRPVVGDAVTAPFKSGVFDVVFHQGLLEHFRDPGSLLAENHRLLRSGGHVLVDVPQTFHPLTIVKKALMFLRSWFAGWETQYTLGQLESLLRRHGFRPEGQIGEWMRPSLIYRCLRQALKAAGVRLPLYPRGVPGIRRVSGAIHRRCSDRRWLAASYPSVGVIARKAEAER